MAVLIARIPVTILSGANVSSEAVLNGHVPTIIEMSAGWDAAVITLAGSTDGSSWWHIFGADGTELTINAAAGRRYTLNGYTTETWSHHNSIKLCSGTAAAPVNQTADRILYVELWE